MEHMHFLWPTEQLMDNVVELILWIISWYKIKKRKKCSIADIDEVSVLEYCLLATCVNV